MAETPSTFGKLVDDLETLADWRDDLNARIKRAQICQTTSVGLSDERLDALLHEGSAWRRAAHSIVKRVTNE
jgi:hypothetical protein